MSTSLPAIQDLGHRLFLRRIAQLDLLDMFDHILKENPSGDLPYHSSLHMYEVAYLAHTLLCHEMASDEQCYHGQRENLERQVICAGLWHDFNHSGGYYVDSVNIRDARAAFNNYHENHPELKVHRGSVVRLIEITEYPFKHVPETLVEKCIRDADLLYCSMPPYSGQRLHLLWTEWSKHNKENSGTFDEFVVRNEKFLEEMVFYTEAAKSIFRGIKDTAILKQREFLALLKGHSSAGL